MSIWDAGYGSPEYLDGGFGSPDFEDSGYGSPFSFEFSAVSEPAAGTLYGEEGGYLITIRSPSRVFTEPSYRVDIVNPSGQLYPQTRPGCYGGIPGAGTEIAPEANGYSLSFALPPLPVIETYSIRISGGGYVLEIPGAVVVTYQPMSFEVDAIRARLPQRVFAQKGAPPPVREV